jgi:ribosomal protein S12 methylthiotransferase accessory factor
LADVIDIDFNSESGFALLAALSDRHGDRIARAARLPTRLFLLRSPWAAGLRLVGGQADSARLGTPGLLEASYSLAGSAELLEDALAACIGEGIERLSQIERPGDVHVECSIDEADRQIMPVARRLIEELFDRSQLPRGTRLAWVRGRSLSGGDEVFLPADWSLRRSGACQLAIPGGALSTGCAAGPNFDAAAARALLELVERDAASLWWIGGQRPRHLSLDGAATAAGVRLLAALRQSSSSRASWLLDITTEVDIPCVAAVSVDDAGRGLACGLAARLTPEEAVRAAVLEMCQMELAYPIAAAKLRERGAEALNETDRRHLARAAKIDAGACELLHPLGAPRRLWMPAGGTSDGDLAALRDILAYRGIQAALIDLTRPEFGIPVVQAIAPGLQLMPGEISTGRLRHVIAATGGGRRLTGGIALH